MTAPDFGALVAAVPDDARYWAVNLHRGTGDRYRCICDDRDARIGRGIAAVRESDEHHNPIPTRDCVYRCACDPRRFEDFAAFCDHRDAAATRAFEEASR